MTQDLHAYNQYVGQVERAVRAEHQRDAAVAFIEVIADTYPDTDAGAAALKWLIDHGHRAA